MISKNIKNIEKIITIIFIVTIFQYIFISKKAQTDFEKGLITNNAFILKDK